MGRGLARAAQLLVPALLVGAALNVVPPSAALAVSNALTNAGFETGTLSGWQTWSNGNGSANYVESTSATRFGRYHATHYSGSAYQVYTYQTVGGLSNGSYSVSAHVLSSGGQNSANMTVEGFGGITRTATIGKSNTWKSVLIADVSVTNNTLKVGFWSDANAGNYLLFDDVLVERIAPVPGEGTEGTNLVTDGGFESSASWSSSGSAAIVASNPRSGGNSMRLGAGTGFSYQDRTGGFTVGQSYALTAYGTTADQGSVAFVGVQARSSSGSILYDAKLPFFAPAYSKNATTLVVPSGTTTLRTYVYKEDGSRSGQVYLDDVSLYATGGQQYYVDGLNGNDSLDGKSPANAWRTLTRASAQTYAPGDAILLAGGQVHNGGLDLGSTSSGTTNRPITITSYGTGRASIYAASSTGIYLQDASGYHIYNVDLYGAGRPTAVYNGIQASNSSSVVQRGLVGIDNVNISAFYLGIQVYGAIGRGFGPVNLQNATTNNNFREGTNVFGYDSRGANDPGGNSWYSQGLFDHVYAGYITANHNDEWSGVLVANAVDGMIEHSSADDVGSTALSGPGPVGIWSIGCERCTVQFNSASHVGSSNPNKLDGDGYDISHNNTNALYQYNYAYANEGPGLLIDDFDVANPTNNKITMRYNVSEANCTDNTRCGEIYVFGNVHNAQIYNNTAYATHGPAARVSGYYGDATHENNVAVKFRNNILSGTGGQLVHLDKQMDGGVYPYGDAGDVSFQGNLYWGGGSAIEFYDRGSSYSSLSDWRTAKSQEKNGTASTGVQADPALVSPGTSGNADNFKIGSTSAALNTGLNLSSLFGTTVGVRDYYGGTLPVGAYDIGAHERP